MKANFGVVRFGASYKDAYVFLNFFTEQGRVESRVLQLSDSIVRLEFPYKEAYGEQMRVNFTFVKDGHRLETDVNLTKRRPERKLDMKWEVFRDRLQPGQQEEWKLVVKTPQGFPAAAEVLATMYDASLDKIFKNNQTLGVFFNRYLPYMRWEESNWCAEFPFQFSCQVVESAGMEFRLFLRVLSSSVRRVADCK